MKATRISGEAGGPGIFAVSDGVRAWDAVVSERQLMAIIDVERSDVFVLTDPSDVIRVQVEVLRRLIAEDMNEVHGESVCADYRRKAISG